MVSAEDTGRPWVDRVFDLRVEDHPEPVEELRRLVRLARAYHKLNEGDELVAAGDMEAAMDAYRAATEVVLDEATGGEAPFWVGGDPGLGGTRGGGGALPATGAGAESTAGSTCCGVCRPRA